MISRLTPRQLEIPELIAKGLTSKEIALRVGTSFRTIDTHRARIMEKLQVGSLAELLRLRSRWSWMISRARDELRKRRDAWSVLGSVSASASDGAQSIGRERVTSDRASARSDVGRRC